MNSYRFANGLVFVHLRLAYLNAITNITTARKLALIERQDLANAYQDCVGQLSLKSAVRLAKTVQEILAFDCLSLAMGLKQEL
jgi:hypothetical protein